MLTDSQRAALAVRLRRGRAALASEIPRRPAGLADVPLSFGQEQLWFIDHVAPGLPTYNIPLALRLSGALDAAALGRAIDAVVARHEALRTRLVTGAGGRPVQVIDPPAPRPLAAADLSGFEPEQRQARLRELIDAEAHRPFTLAGGPLLRTSLLRLAAGEHVLLAVVHHAVFDGWSGGVLVAELAALYRQEAAGDGAGLAELPVQFADYAVWERDRRRGPALAELADYWREAMAGFGTAGFPTDRPRPVLDTFEGALAHRLTDRRLLDDLRELSRREGTTLLVTLLAGLLVLLHRYTGQTNLVVGTFSASRTRAELAALIGFLVNTLPIRADLSGDPAFTGLLAQVRDTTVGAYAHQDLPFAQLVDALRVDRDPGRAPVFQIELSYAERDDAPVRAAGVEFARTDLVVGVNAAKFDLGFLAEARPGGLWFECTYKTGLFDAATATRLLASFEVLLRGVVADPSARLSRLPVLTAAELHRELVEWNDSAAPIAAVCPHQAVEAQAARTPDDVAAEFEDQRLSYAGLNRRANQVARRLRAAGVGPEVLVGVCMTTGLRRLAALLGIWKAGGGYVPLDPALPAARLSFMISDTGLPVILTDAACAASVPASGAATVIDLDAGWAAIGALGDGDLAGAGAALSNVAYVIYTSGSTGQPKGVVVEHRQVTSALRAGIAAWDIGRPDRVLQFASLSFDASVEDTFMPLLAGARVVLAAAETLHSPPRLAALIRERHITVVPLSPAVLSLLGDEEFPEVRLLSVGGEELGTELARRWVRPGLRLVNVYGPTEATVSSTFSVVDAGTPLPPPIGAPLPNSRAYVLDGGLNPVPVGVTGELHIGGAGVARGYLGRPALTARRFIPDPFCPGQRLYQTGDLARRRPDGSIMFLRRADTQVKIRGLRIELGEIEAALAAHPGVAQAAVTVVPGPAGDPQLAGYLVAEPGTTPDPAALRAYLARILPGYMIPGHLITLARFPLSPSDKIDRAALPAPRPAPASARPVAPATVTETLLARLYATVLGRDCVSADDSFFDIGGSSLQVMRLTDLISRHAHVDVGVTAVFLHPTPRQLAARIDAMRSDTMRSDTARSGTTQSAAGPLIELSDGELPLFVIHPVGGTVFAYAPLARGLAGAFRVRGLEAPALSRPGSTAATLAGLADDYTRRIRAAQPAGPYRLAGWSMGGIAAFEIARRLEQAGAEVTLLALLDAPYDLPGPGTATPAQRTAQFLADATRSLGWDTADPPDPATASPAQQLTWLAARLAGPDTDTDTDHHAITTQLQRRHDIFQAHSRLLAGYRPALPPVRAPALVIGAARSPNAAACTRWPRRLAGPVTTRTIDTDHYALLRPPHTAEIATTIRQTPGGHRAH
jgi:amino acid adenylation domain-containing protein